MLSRWTNRRSIGFYRELKTVDPGTTYFAFTLTEEDGQQTVSVQSRFAGWTPDLGPAAVELREASPIDAHKMTAAWDQLGEPWMVVSTEEHLVILLRCGGNALIAEPLARRCLSDHVEPHPAAHDGAMGFRSFNPTSHEATKHRPRPWQRREVLERDNHECQQCGARRADGAQLVLHHVRMFSRGGLTSIENLITLCDQCHKNLDPHEDLMLFFRPGGLWDQRLRREGERDHGEAVRQYRARIAGSVPMP